MNSKQRISVIFSMLSLTVLMLCFQNCSQSGGSGSLESDSGIVNPPIVFASKTLNCAQPSTDFKVADMVYICVQDAGAAPIYCHTYLGNSNCNYENVSTATGWTSQYGNWVKGYSASTVFGVGSFISYIKHTTDPSSFGQATFNVSQ